MTYDELMKTITLNKVYPIKGPELETKKDENKRTFKFRPTGVILVDRTRVRVFGVDKHEVWCRLDFKLKTMPKWLKREMEKAAKK